MNVNMLNAQHPHEIFLMLKLKFSIINLNIQCIANGLAPVLY